MRHIHRILLALVFACLLLGAGATKDDPALVYNTDTVAFVFDDVYTTANIVLARIEVEVTTESGAAVATWVLTTGWAVEGGFVRAPIRASATPLTNGIYRLRSRVGDAFGNTSAWSEYLFVNKQWKTLPTPGGCRTVSQ